MELVDPTPEGGALYELLLKSAGAASPASIAFRR